MTPSTTKSDGTDGSMESGQHNSIGPGSIIALDVSMGSRTTVGANVTIVGPTKIGDDVRIGTGARILSGTVIGPTVTVGANAVIGSNDGRGTTQQGTSIGDQATIGAGAIVGAGIRIGSHSMIHPGAVVSTDVPAHAIVAGNPARIQGYANAPARNPLNTTSPRQGETVTSLGIGGCELWQLPSFRDLRGSLVPLEHDTDLPFIPVRTFFVFDVPGQEVRGEHAHRNCAQFLIAVHGSLSVVVDDGSEATEVQLDHPSIGLHIPPGVWGVQYRFGEDGVLAVHASLAYDGEDYIRDYDEFSAWVRLNRKEDS